MTRHSIGSDYPPDWPEIAQAVSAFMRTHKPLTLEVHICAKQHPTAPAQIGQITVVRDRDVVHGRTCIPVDLDRQEDTHA